MNERSDLILQLRTAMADLATAASAHHDAADEARREAGRLAAQAIRDEEQIRELRHLLGLLTAELLMDRRPELTKELRAAIEQALRPPTLA